MRKRRTRQHQIEDLSYNFVEKQVLLAFHIFRRYSLRDYSYDGTISTFNEKGEAEAGMMFVQVKATEKPWFSKRNGGFSLSLSKRDIELWLDESYPVIVVLYDAQNDVGYYVELHSYFRKNRIALQNINKEKTIFIKRENLFSPCCKANEKSQK
ncbi:MAG TPA: DUF4365 domain-containing protein [Bacteroidetes bacterium]|nr:DUF4365 domain-containing protein [Bacteroidota bacterium]